MRTELPWPLSRKITQRDLAAVLKFDEHIAELKRQLAPLESERVDLEARLLAMVDAGVPTQRGGLHLEVVIKSGQRRPAWRQVVVERLGVQVAREVEAATPCGADHRSIRVTHKL